MVAGGATCSLEALHESGETWEVVGMLSAPRVFCALVALGGDDSVYVLGGAGITVATDELHEDGCKDDPELEVSAEGSLCLTLDAREWRVVDGWGTFGACTATVG